MKKFLISVAALGFYGSPAIAQDTQDPEETDTADEDIVVEGEVDEDDIERCRYVPITGTRFRERICMTQNELDEQRQNHRDMMNDHRYDGPGPVEQHPTQPGPAVPPI